MVKNTIANKQDRAGYDQHTANYLGYVRAEAAFCNGRHPVDELVLSKPEGDLEHERATGL